MFRSKVNTSCLNTIMLLNTKNKLQVNKNQLIWILYFMYYILNLIFFFFHLILSIIFNIDNIKFIIFYFLFIFHMILATGGWRIRTWLLLKIFTICNRYYMWDLNNNLWKKLYISVTYIIIYGKIKVKWYILNEWISNTYIYSINIYWLTIDSFPPPLFCSYLKRCIS